MVERKKIVNWLAIGLIVIFGGAAILQWSEKNQIIQQQVAQRRTADSASAYADSVQVVRDRAGTVVKAFEAGRDLHYQILVMQSRKDSVLADSAIMRYGRYYDSIKAIRDAVGMLDSL